MANNDNFNGWATEETLRELLRRSPDPDKLADALSRVAGDPDKLRAILSEQNANIRGNTRATSDLNKGLGGLFGGATGSKWSNINAELEGLGSAGGKAEGALSKLGRVGSVVTQLLGAGWERVTRIAEGVYDAYDQGMVFAGDMTQYTQSMNDLGVDLQTFQKIINKSSLVIASMGTKRFFELGKAMQMATNSGTSLGLHTDEVVEYMGAYTDMLRMTGSLQGKTNQQLIDGTKAYVEQLNAVSQATGKRREQILQETKAALQAQPTYFATMAKLPQQIRENMLAMVPQFEVFGNQASTMMETVSRYISRGGIAGVQTEQREAFIRAGAVPLLEEYIASLKAGDKERANDTAAQIRVAMERYLAATPAYAPFSPNQTVAGAQAFAAAMFQEIKTLQGTVQPPPADAGKVIETQAKLDRVLSAVNKQLDNAAIALGLTFIPEVALAADAAIALSESFDTMIKRMGLVDEKGHMTREGGIVASSLGAMGIVGSGALLGQLWKFISPKLGQNMGPMLERLGIQAPGFSQQGAQAVRAGNLASFLGRAMAALSAGTAAMETYSRTGELPESLAVGGGAYAGAEFGGALGLRLGRMSGNRYISMLGALAGGGLGSVIGQEGVEELFGLNAPADAAAAGQPMSDEDRAIQERWQRLAEAEARRSDDNKTLLEDLKDKLGELVTAITDQTRILDGSISRSGPVIR